LLPWASCVPGRSLGEGWNAGPSPRRSPVIAGRRREVRV